VRRDVLLENSPVFDNGFASFALQIVEGAKITIAFFNYDVKVDEVLVLHPIAVKTGLIHKI